MINKITLMILLFLIFRLIFIKSSNRLEFISLGILAIFEVLIRYFHLEVDLYERSIISALFINETFKLIHLNYKKFENSYSKVWPLIVAVIYLSGKFLSVGENLLFFELVFFIYSCINLRLSKSSFVLKLSFLSILLLLFLNDSVLLIESSIDSSILFFYLYLFVVKMFIVKNSKGPIFYSPNVLFLLIQFWGMNILHLYWKEYDLPYVDSLVSLSLISYGVLYLYQYLKYKKEQNVSFLSDSIINMNVLTVCVGVFLSSSISLEIISICFLFNFLLLGYINFMKGQFNHIYRKILIFSIMLGVPFTIGHDFRNFQVSEIFSSYNICYNLIFISVISFALFQLLKEENSVVFKFEVKYIYPILIMVIAFL